MRKPLFQSIEDYLEESELYRLGALPTESNHPDTVNLSEMAKTDIPRALEILKKVDLQALKHLQNYGSEFSRLSEAIKKTLEQGKKIFLCGCGATGRLSLALESLWRAGGGQDQVVAFMAGGDVALVRSVENFEDRPELGARHLKTLGFSEGDLLLGITEGGETPFVIGATEMAAATSQKPYFIYCNPADILSAHVERSRRVIQDSRIEKISIPIGAMALSGSTRLQASTVQMLGVGLALFAAQKGAPLTKEEFVSQTQQFKDFFAAQDLGFLQEFILAESEIVQSGKTLIYQTDRYGITILTDTTERSPTFSVQPFENKFDPQPLQHAWSYLCLPQTVNSEQAWQQILGRLPLGLPWPEYSDKLSQKVALGFDFSQQVLSQRKQSPVLFQIESADKAIRFKLQQHEHKVSTQYQQQEMGLFFQHLLLKLILNIHSLLFMGRLGRYQGNVMTWVRPSNGKLIDRSIRYVQMLLAAEGHTASYEEIAHLLFDVNKQIDANESIVLQTLKRCLLQRRQRHQK